MTVASVFTTRCFTIAGVVLVLSGCGAAIPADETASPAPTVDSSASSAIDVGDDATWTVLDPSAVTADSTTLELAVTRVECAGGVTGEVRAPVIVFEAERIVIRTGVEENGAGAYTCQGNDAVPITVELTEAVGDRVLVDGLCLASETSNYASCLPDGVRWRP